MQFIDYDDFERLASADPLYYAGRWEYMGKVIEFLKNRPENFASALELGPYLFSIAKEAVTMGIAPEADPDMKYYACKHPVYDIVRNADTVPWPAEDKSFDIFIGLQVLEHTSDKKSIFAEIERVAHYAAITLPYKWQRKDPGNCHTGIDEDVIRGWSGREPVYSRVIANVTGRNSRIFLFYDFGSKL